ncbi:hypothetical protein CYLTODRAFT_441593 [Cylindrobasidium torrendii FP15055 ss-10]|uniref:Uncharacterized protein n=1 Tax=Cylindrobasidium torrendii FP15055 ss-10 TaxID=1314674 RepID=A0A0D7BKF8_9AGAR|nr:hypothetical protein CYLTODRAFT_441593 [Cylindrobasidium torrendii FP15055 ss-10]
MKKFTGCLGPQLLPPASVDMDEDENDNDNSDNDTVPLPASPLLHMFDDILGQKLTLSDMFKPEDMLYWLERFTVMSRVSYEEEPAFYKLQDTKVGGVVADELDLDEMVKKILVKSIYKVSDRQATKTVGRRRPDTSEVVVTDRRPPNTDGDDKLHRFPSSPKARIASIAQGYRACPVEHCPCPHHRTNFSQPEGFVFDSAALREFGSLQTTNEQPTAAQVASINASIASLSAALNDIHSARAELKITQNAIENIPDSNELSKYYGQLTRQFKKTVRSGRIIPLTVSIGLCSQYNDGLVGGWELNPITFLLPCYADSITHLTLFLPAEALDRMNPVGPQLTRLVYATVANIAPDRPVYDMVNWFFEAFLQSTTLRTFNAINFDHLHNVEIPNGVKHLALRHYAIKHDEKRVQQDNDSYGILTHIDTLTPQLRDNLETLCIDIGGKDNFEIPDKTNLSMPKLKKLTVTSVGDEQIYALLELMITPSLESLSLSSLASSLASHDIDAIGDMAQRCACRLTYLELVFLAETSTPVPVLTALDQLPTLIHLKLRYREKSGIIIWDSDEGMPNEGQILLPALQTLELHATPSITQALPALADWIESRVKNAPLKKLAIVSWVPDLGAVKNSDASRIRVFRERMEEVDRLETRAGFSEIKVYSGPGWIDSEDLDCPHKWP